MKIFATDVFVPDYEVDVNGNTVLKETGKFERMFVVAEKVIALKDVVAVDGQKKFGCYLFVEGLAEPIMCKDEAITIAKVMMGVEDA